MNRSASCIISPLKNMCYVSCSPVLGHLYPYKNQHQLSYKWQANHPKGDTETHWEGPASSAVSASCTETLIFSSTVTNG